MSVRAGLMAVPHACATIVRGWCGSKGPEVRSCTSCSPALSQQVLDNVPDDVRGGSFAPNFAVCAMARDILPSDASRCRPTDPERF